MRASAPAKQKKSPKKRREKLNVVHQVIEVSSPSSEGEGTVAKEEQQLSLYESQGKREDIPLVNGTISPLSIPMKIVVPKLGV